MRLADFEGPFDLLLQLISKHKLEVTELSLHLVTDEFIAHISAQGSGWDLDEATEFLVIAATLLDLKSARLLPSGEVEDEEDLAILEARDLLFARLLQYRAFKEMAARFDQRITSESRRWYRRQPLPEPFASLLPEVLLAISPAQLASLAAQVLAPRPEPVVSVSHLHAPAVSVREQAILLAERIRRKGVCSFRSLTKDADNTAVVVARFLALLELYRDRIVGFDQIEALGELNVRWLADESFDSSAIESDEFDDLGEQDG